MRRVNPSRKFRRDYKRCRKRGLELSKLESIIDLLLADQELPKRCRPHILSGNWANYWECHISADWLLIYQYDDEANTLDLVRLGTHGDLF